MADPAFDAVQDDSLGGQIKQALRAGYTRDEVTEHLKTLPFYDRALKDNYTPDEILGHPDILDAYKQHAAEQWGPGQAALNAGTLGAWRPIQAGIQSGAIDPMTGELTTNTDAYAPAMKESGINKEAWESLHPGQSLGIDMVASTPATMVGLGAANTLTRAGLRGLPAATRFFMGQGGTGPISRTASTMTHGALSGAEAGGMQAGMHPEIPFEDQVATGGMAGGALGPVSLLTNPLLRRGITTRSAQTAQDAAALGIDLTPKQLQPRPGSVSDAKGTDQIRQVNRALFRTMGHDADEFTQDNFDAAAHSISREFQTVIPRVHIDPANPAMHTAMTNLETDAAASAGANPLTDPAYQRFESAMIAVRRNLAAAAGRGTPTMPGVLSGQEYEYMTKKGGLVDRLIQNQETKNWGVRLRTILDDAMIRGPPADKAALDTARQHWKNMMILEGPAEKAQNTGGNINPAHLPGAIARSYKDYAWTGAGNLGTISEAGAFMKQRPTAQGDTYQPPSGTALMKAFKKFGPTVGVTAGALELAPAVAEHMVSNPLGAAGILGAAGLGAGYGAHLLTRHLTQMPSYRDAIINRILDPTAFQAAPNALIAPTVGAATSYADHPDDQRLGIRMGLIQPQPQ